MKIETYLKNNFPDVTVVGVVNPSVIVNHNGESYVVYVLYHGKRIIIVCHGESRYEVEKLTEIKQIIDRNNEKNKRKGNLQPKR